MKRNIIPFRSMSSLFIGIAFVIVSSINASAFNMRRITNSDGMTNSAVLSLCQDSIGFLWMGTCDGVNIYDGATVYPLSDLYPLRPISGNIVEGIMESSGGMMWIRTNHGINRLNRVTGDIKVFPQFQGREILKKNYRGEIFVLGEDRHVYHYNPKEENFEPIEKISVDRDTIHEISFVADKLIIFSQGGIFSKTIELQKDGYSVGKTVTVSTNPLKFARQKGKVTFSIDEEGTVRKFDLSTFTNNELISLRSLIATRGLVSDISTDTDNNIFVSFETSGVVKVSPDNDFSVTDLGLRAGVFCLLPSQNQDVMWIGSDCNGLYTYYNGKYDILTLGFDHFDDLISHPVRSIMTDRYQNLWLGTKGDGLLMIENFDYRTGNYGKMRLYTSTNSPLRHNMVFATAESRKDRFWIGSEEGLNIYDYKTQKVYDIESGENIRWVHGIYEQNDSTLWIASIGQGIWRATIDNSSPVARFKSVKHYTLDNGNFSSNYFFSLSVDEDGNPVFSNRGIGVIIYDEKSDSLKPIKLHNKYNTNSVNDVFVTYKDNDVYWLGTGHGLIRRTPDSEELFRGKEEGFSNSTIHSILKSDDGDIWVSTNRGIVCFNPATKGVSLFDEDFGVNVTEFSDGAACLINEGKTLVFGGTDGITLFTNNPDINADNYRPLSQLTGLTIGGQVMGINSEFNASPNRLEIPYDRQYVTLKFGTPDFINSYNCSYLYSLDGKKWINNGRDNSWSFTNMAPGDYKLHVRYINLQTGLEGESIVLNLRITPPWYLSTIAKILYVALLAAIIGVIIFYLLRNQKRKQQREFDTIKAAHKEEVYEEKLKFFTNITHEFCTPLTLIYGPCERILSYEGTDNYIRKYVSLIRNNTQRLNNLIQEIIDFRRLETGNNQRKIRRIDVSELCNDIIDSFSDLAERNNINVVKEISSDITWNTDYRSINKIVTNLVSNAFKYTDPGGTVRISLDLNNNDLKITVYNTGKGIREEDKEKVFNHYAILDNVEEKATKGLIARNGLGMAICHSMVDLLEGKIEIDSEVGKYACFIVTLPQLEVNPDTQVEKSDNTLTITPPANDISRTNFGESGSSTDNLNDNRMPDSPRSTASTKILIVDDNEDMLTLLSDSLSEYEIITATDGDEAIKKIIDTMPDLVITDIMMPGTDGLELTRQIKNNRHTMHVPLIILSAKNTNEEIVAGIETGADVYISKPFSFSYLRAVIKRLLDSNRKLREYYNSSASAYEYSGGQLMGKEDKAYLEKITSFIDDNIDNTELTPDMIASHLGTSTRNLYRRFKELDQIPPNDYIKTHRVKFAARLLCTTSLTIQEIMYRSGFSNRSHFYREFDKFFHTTPKEYRNQNHRKDDSLNKQS